MKWTEGAGLRKNAKEIDGSNENKMFRALQRAVTKKKKKELALRGVRETGRERNLETTGS